MPLTPSKPRTRLGSRRILGPSALGVLALVATACGSSASSTSPAAAGIAATGTTPSSAISAVPPASANPSPSPSTPSAENLPLDGTTRAQLTAAAARLNSLPASAYLGLVKGESYYGFDPATNTYWAGGALDPSPSSQRAQVSVQDDGGYYIFREPAGGSWTASAEGLAGIAGTTCSVHIPLALAALWNWPAGACHPAGI
jgi:hypothetical protein